MIHKLKILPQYFNEVRVGNKTFEIRKNDRGFKVGDELLLEEYALRENDPGIYTGRHVLVKVTYILDNAEYLNEGYVCLAIKLVF